MPRTRAEKAVRSRTVGAVREETGPTQYGNHVRYMRDLHESYLRQPEQRLARHCMAWEGAVLRTTVIANFQSMSFSASAIPKFEYYADIRHHVN
jgi:hypothetical protein